MKRIGLVAFTATSGVLVPFLLHGGRDQVAKLVAPAKRTIEIGGATIEVTTDRTIVDPGHKVNVELAATAAKRAHPRVAVLVFEQRGMGQYRNELPPHLIDETEIKLDVDADKPAKRELSFTLPGEHRGSDMDGKWTLGHYTVIVVPQADESRFHALTSYETAPDPDAPATAARLDLFTRPADSTLAIKAPDRAKVGGDIAVEVRVHNPTHHEIEAVTVDLGATPSGDAVHGDSYLGLDPSNVAITAPDDTAFSLGAGETKKVVFHVRASERGVLGLFANARCADNCNDDGHRLDDAVIDAVEIVDEPVAAN